MSRRHRAILRSVMRLRESERAVSRMNIGQVLANAEKLFAPLQGMKFAAITQPLYTSESPCLGTSLLRSRSPVTYAGPATG